MATPATKVTSKGQVTIPKSVRDLLDLRPGASVQFGLAEDGRVVMFKAGGKEEEPPQSRFAKARGTADAGMTTDEIMALTRGDDDEP